MYKGFAVHGRSCSVGFRELMQRMRRREDTKAGR
jgi:hypothetical protein